jgi:hypothetical protein
MPIEENSGLIEMLGDLEWTFLVPVLVVIGIVMVLRYVFGFKGEQPYDSDPFWPDDEDERRSRRGMTFHWGNLSIGNDTLPSHNDNSPSSAQHDGDPRRLE